VSADAAGDAEGSVADDLRDFWDVDAATYDSSPSHYPQRPQEQAAWGATLRRLLPDPPAAVLDMGAGTGFLSLLLAAQGYEVTAADFAPGMLVQLKAKAASRGLAIQAVETDALHPPAGEFDSVVERHLIWTLPDPAGALGAAFLKRIYDLKWARRERQGRAVNFTADGEAKFLHIFAS